MAQSKNGHWFVSGAGGKSHYQASPEPDWSFVNDKDCGYLQIQIDNTDGKITSSLFKDWTETNPLTPSTST